MFRSAGCALSWMVWVFVFGMPAFVFADHPIAFPWGHSSHSTHPVAGSAVHYRTLPVATAHSQPDPNYSVQPLPPKVGYAYGWFGSNPTPQAVRHFGYHQNFTQWKITP